MKLNWRRIGKVIFKTLLIGIPGGFLVFAVWFFGLLGLMPASLVKVWPVLGFGLVAALILRFAFQIGKKWRRRVWAVYGAAALVCLSYAGYGVWSDSLPTVDDRDALLYRYEPFAEGTQAVYLQEASTLRFTPEELDGLRIDGATALYPVYAAFVQATFPEGEYPRYQYEGAPGPEVSCNGTTFAYEQLLKGEADVIFCAAPSQAQQDAAAELGLELHLTPVGREAFVFFVNRKNPVTGLTVEQIRGIYSGEITNWSELGGKWQSIRPFQRDEGSGSQTAMQALMAGTELMEPELHDRIDGMGGIVTEVADYRNHSNAIGYSFRFYASGMVVSDQIRLLALNGVEPTRDTIRDGSYPIASEFYAVTAAPVGQPGPEETDGVLKAWLEWITGPQGQWIVDQTGYVSLTGE